MPKLMIEVPQENMADLMIRLIEYQCSFEVVYGDAPAKKPRTLISKTKCGQAVMRICQQYSGPFTKDMVESQIENDGFAITSAGPCLSALLKEGFLAREGKRGAYIYRRTL